MANNESGAGTVVVAFVLGAITGAAVALLMAPASGEETRRMLAEKAREGRDKAGEAARQGKEIWNRQRENLSNAFDRGREAYQQARGATPPGTPGEEM
jgi:gas vesicle protein